jgi:hypothetical protein
VRHETRRPFMNKKREYLKEKLLTLKKTARIKIPEIHTEA